MQVMQSTAVRHIELISFKKSLDHILSITSEVRTYVCIYAYERAYVCLFVRVCGLYMLITKTG